VHDELGQALTVLKMRLTALVKEAAGQPHEAKLRQLADNASEIMDTVRRIATHLRPSLLDSLGLDAAIESHLQEFQEATGIEAKTDLDSVARDHP
jgi:signal transduction histidine kinase